MRFIGLRESIQEIDAVAAGIHILLPCLPICTAGIQYIQLQTPAFFNDRIV